MSDEKPAAAEPEIRAKLKAMLWEGPARDLMLADLARTMIRTISDHAETINRAGFGDPLGLIQHFLSDYYAISLGRLFDVDRRHDVQSLPRLLDLLDEHAEEIQPQDPVRIRMYLAAQRRHVPMADDDLTRALVACIRLRAPRADDQRPLIAKAFEAMKIRRDKRVAHRELIKVEDLPQTTWAEEADLLDLVREVIGAIGLLFGDLFEHEGEWIQDADVARTRRRMERLLERAGAIGPREERS